MERFGCEYSFWSRTWPQIIRQASSACFLCLEAQPDGAFASCVFFVPRSWLPATHGHFIEPTPFLGRASILHVLHGLGIFEAFQPTNWVTPSIPWIHQAGSDEVNFLFAFGNPARKPESRFEQSQEQFHFAVRVKASLVLSAAVVVLVSSSLFPVEAHSWAQQFHLGKGKPRSQSHASVLV